jgi:hypothetical protein
LYFELPLLLLLRYADKFFVFADLQVNELGDNKRRPHKCEADQNPDSACGFGFDHRVTPPQTSRLAARQHSF